jgi:GT2 family glycosyltransferase
MDDNSLIVIVTYNSQDFIDDCLKSIASQTYDKWQLVVVDNNSSDGTVEKIRQFRNQTTLFDNNNFKLVRLKKNIGFSRAVNHAASRTAPAINDEPFEYLILLNPDICLFPDALEKLISTFDTSLTEESSDIGAAGGLILEYDRDTIQHRTGKITENFITYHEGTGEDFNISSESPGDIIIESDYVTGAFFATRFSLFSDSGGFDRGYRPVYFEELDYCLKLSEAGWRIVSNQQAVCRHFEGASVKSFSGRFYRHYHKNRLRCALLNMDILELVRIFLPAEIRWLKNSATRDQAVPLLYAYFINSVFLLYNLAQKIKNYFILNRIELK